MSPLQQRASIPTLIFFYLAQNGSKLLVDFAKKTDYFLCGSTNLPQLNQWGHFPVSSLTSIRFSIFSGGESTTAEGCFSLLVWPCHELRLYQVLATPSPRLRSQCRMSPSGCMDRVPRHYDALPVSKLPVCDCRKGHIVGGKYPDFISIFFSWVHKQHNYSTITAWFTEWNLFCLVLRGWLLFLSLLQLKPKNLQFPTITVVSKVNVWIFCWDTQEGNRKAACQSLTISASGLQGHNDSTVDAN